MCFCYFKANPSHKLVCRFVKSTFLVVAHDIYFIASHYLRLSAIWIIIPGTLLHALKFSVRPLHILPLRPFFIWPFRKTSNRPSWMGSTSRMVHQLRKKSRKVVPNQTNQSFLRTCFQIRVRWITWWASSRPRRLLWFLRWWLWGGWIFSSRGLLLVSVQIMWSFPWLIVLLTLFSQPSFRFLWRSALNQWCNEAFQHLTWIRDGFRRCHGISSTSLVWMASISCFWVMKVNVSVPRATSFAHCIHRHWDGFTTDDWHAKYDCRSTSCSSRLQQTLQTGKREPRVRWRTLQVDWGGRRGSSTEKIQQVAVCVVLTWCALHFLQLHGYGIRSTKA